MVLNFKFNVLLNFISVYFVFYISFDLFLSETTIYSTKICEFFVGSSRPPYMYVVYISCFHSALRLKTHVEGTFTLNLLLPYFIDNREK